MINSVGTVFRTGGAVPIDLMEVIRMAEILQVKEKFVIDDAVKADWALEKIREHKKIIREYETRRDALIAEYQKRIDKVTKDCTDDCADDLAAIDNLTAMLLEYAQTAMPKNKRTLKFGCGNISFRKQQTKFYFADGEEPSAKSERLVEYLRKIDQHLIIPHYTAAWDRFKRRLAVDTTKNNEIVDTVTGEVITDIYAVTPPDKFIVDTGE